MGNFQSSFGVVRDEDSSSSISKGKRPSEIVGVNTEWRSGILQSSSSDEGDQDSSSSGISWTDSRLSAVIDYALKLNGINSDLIPLCPTEFCLQELLYRKKQNLATNAVTSTLQLKELLKVPKFRQLSDNGKTLERNELVAAFISLLLQLLDHETELIVGYGDRIVCLKKELGFLVTVLGDTSILGTELQQIQNPLAEFEAVASEAASVVDSFIFNRYAPLKSIRMDKDLDALFHHIDLLKDHITKFLNLLPFIIQDHMTPKTAAFNSLFIVDSVLCSNNATDDCKVAFQLIV